MVNFVYSDTFRNIVITEAHSFRPRTAKTWFPFHTSHSDIIPTTMSFWVSSEVESAQLIKNISGTRRSSNFFIYIETTSMIAKEVTNPHRALMELRLPTNHRVKPVPASTTATPAKIHIAIPNPN